MMKKINNIVSYVQPSINSFKVLAATSLTLSIAGLMGCQTTAGSSYDNKSGLLISEQQPAKAKNQLQKALEKQIRSSFSFETKIKLSNAKRLKALENATPEQLANTSSKENYCEHTHDNAYVSLLKKSKAEGNDIEDTAYESQREKLKQDYQTCEKSYDEWYDNNQIGDNKKEYLPNYDTNHTEKDLKSVKIRNEYLIEPLEVKLTGVYQPLKGKIALLPSARFKSRNILIGMNQPVYIDVKAGDIYLWAENFAYPTSALIDEKLGKSWQNKWLKISLNDGSLPESFSKDLIKSLVNSYKKSYEQTPTSVFNYLTKSEIATALPNLSEQNIGMFSNTSTIISQNSSEGLYRRSAYLSAKTLYDEMYSKYPKLLSDDTKNDADKESNYKYPSMSSANLMVVLFDSVKTQIDNYESEFITDDGVLKVLESDSNILSRTYYGLNGKKITWTHVRYELPSKLALPINLASQGDIVKEENMVIDSTTTFSSASNVPFKNLPADAQVPNNHNSIDAREYMNDLIEHYKTGDGTVLAKMFFQSKKFDLSGIKEQKETSKELEDTPNETENKDESDEISDMLLSQNTAYNTKLTPLEITAHSEAAEATKAAFINGKLNRTVLVNLSDVVNTPDVDKVYDTTIQDIDTKDRVTKSSSKVEVFTRKDIIPNKDSNFEPAICVLMNTTTDIMCSADFINTDSAIEVAGCLNEQVQLEKAFEIMCPNSLLNK